MAEASHCGASGSMVVPSTCLVAQCSGTAAVVAELELKNGGAKLGDGWQGAAGRLELWGPGGEDRDGRPRAVGFGGGVAVGLGYRAEVAAAKFNRAAIFGGLGSVVGWAQIWVLGRKILVATQFFLSLCI